MPTQLAQYGVAIFSIGALVWIMTQVFRFITDNTAALRELIVLIREQTVLAKEQTMLVKEQTSLVKSLQTEVLYLIKKDT